MKSIKRKLDLELKLVNKYDDIYNFSDEVNLYNYLYNIKSGFFIYLCRMVFDGGELNGS